MLTDGSADDVWNQIANQCALILGLTEGDLSTDVDFFEAGGDSFAALELITRLENYFSLTLPLDLLFLDGSLGGLAEKISRARDETDTGYQ